MFKRLFDFIFSSILLLLLTPVMGFVAVFILVESKGGVFYSQIRIGRGGMSFKIYKFRTMYIDADKKGLLTVGMKDSRITKAGYFLRKYKLDELPQLLNVIKGEMSLVGPRPEVKKYVDLYSETQKKILRIKPGITDYASIQFSNENELLDKVSDPEKLYIEEIMPAKLRLNLAYLESRSFLTDLKIILKTFLKIIGC